MTSSLPDSFQDLRITMILKFYFFIQYSNDTQFFQAKNVLETNALKTNLTTGHSHNKASSIFSDLEHFGIS